MRLLEVKRSQRLAESGNMVARIAIKFVHQGITDSLWLNSPANWNSLTRAQRVTWARTEITNHLAATNYAESEEIIYPDRAASEQAATDFEAMPGWATWTAAEAMAWVDANVPNAPAGTKSAIRALAQAIVYLRDRVIEK